MSRPVESIPVDDPSEAPEDGIALCLSGGGFRAMLFHVGALARLNEACLLPRLNRVSSVSGGSITAAVLGQAWAGLDFDAGGKARHLEQTLVRPLRRFATLTIDLWAAPRGLLRSGAAAAYVSARYRRHLFGDRTLQHLPARNGPRFVINASNLQSGALWRFSQPYARDYRVGSIPLPRISLADAVAASSAFPPFLSPMRLHFAEDQYAPGSGDDLQRPPYTTDVHLTDGGVYDNLGLETAWKRYTTVLVSDGGGHMQPEPNPPSDWIRHTRRVLDIVDNQVRSLRKRQLIDSYQAPPHSPDHRRGAYWGVRTDIRNYGLADAFPAPLAATTALAAIPTRLAPIAPSQQERLINWGFAVCDAALRAHFDPTLSRPERLPYPGAGIG